MLINRNTYWYLCFYTHLVHLPFTWNAWCVLLCKHNCTTLLKTLLCHSFDAGTSIYYILSGQHSFAAAFRIGTIKSKQGIPVPRYATDSRSTHLLSTPVPVLPVSAFARRIWFLCHRCHILPRTGILLHNRQRKVPECSFIRIIILQFLPIITFISPQVGTGVPLCYRQVRRHCQPPPGACWPSSSSAAFSHPIEAEWPGPDPAERVGWEPQCW